MNLSDKLQLNERAIAVCNPPKGMSLDVDVSDDPETSGVLWFVRTQADLKDAEPVFAAARDDRMAWIAYPKAGKLETDLNRDKLGRLTEPHGIRPVRQIAIDDTWSALRFRPGQIKV